MHARTRICLSELARATKFRKNIFETTFGKLFLVRHSDGLSASNNCSASNKRRPVTQLWDFTIFLLFVRSFVRSFHFDVSICSKASVGMGIVRVDNVLTAECWWIGADLKPRCRFVSMAAHPQSATAIYMSRRVNRQSYTRFRVTINGCLSAQRNTAQYKIIVTPKTQRRLRQKPNKTYVRNHERCCY